MNKSSLFERIMPFKPARYSLIKGLSNIIPIEKIEEVSSLIADRRTLLQSLSKNLKIDEYKLIQTVGRELNLHTVRDVAPIALDVLPNDVSIRKLRRVGVVPVIKNNSISTKECVDKDLSKQGRLGFSGAQVCLGSWSDISRALDTSELLEKQSDAVSAATDNLDETCFKVISQLIEDIVKFNVNEFYVSFLEDDFSYFFITQEGRRGEGTLSEVIKESMKKLLEHLSQGVDEKYNSDLNFTVSHEKKNQRYLIKLKSILDLDSCVADEEGLSSACFEDVKQQHFEISESLKGEISKRLLEFSSVGNLKIVVLDDNDIFAKIVSSYISSHQIEVEVFNDSKVFNEEIENEILNADLFIIDMHMPVYTGLDLVKNLKQSATYCDKPIFILTSERAKNVKVELMLEGADLVIDKSEDPSVLLLSIFRYLKRVSS